MKAIQAAIALVFLAPAPALADACSNAQTQAQMDVCAANEYRTATDTINNLYKETFKRYDPQGQDLLRKSERAWISFRDAECDFRTAGSKGSTIWPMIHAQCLTELTRARIKQLEAAANCEEGDLSCRQPGR